MTIMERTMSTARMWPDLVIWPAQLESVTFAANDRVSTTTYCSLCSTARLGQEVESPFAGNRLPHCSPLAIVMPRHSSWLLVHDSPASSLQLRFG